jgi:hypothetical protein
MAAEHRRHFVGHAALATAVKPTKKSLPTLQRKRLVFLSDIEHVHKEEKPFNLR